MIYIATFTYIQSVDDVRVEGNFQVVGEVSETGYHTDVATKPRVVRLTEHAIEKVKQLVESDGLDFSGTTTFFLDSLIEFEDPRPGHMKPLIVNMATTLGKDVNLTEVPLAEDTDLVTVHRSTQIGPGSKAIYMHPTENPS